MCLNFNTYTLLSFFLSFICSVIVVIYLGWEKNLIFFNKVLVSFWMECNNFFGFNRTEIVTNFPFFGGYIGLNVPIRLGKKESLGLWVDPNVNENVSRRIKRWWVSSLCVLKTKAQNVNEMCEIHPFIHSLSGDKKSLVLVRPNVNEMCEIHPFIHSLSGNKESLVLVHPNVNEMCEIHPLATRSRLF